MPSIIEEKLKEYRLLKEKERKAELLSEKSLWEKLFPPKVANLLKFQALQNQNKIVESAGEIIPDDQVSITSNIVENISTSKIPLTSKPHLRKKSKPPTGEGNVLQSKVIIGN